MTMRQPPPLAAWLLERFVSGYRSEALSGDLLEEYQTGRTPGWYWREVIAALLVSARCGVRWLLSRYAAEIILLIVGMTGGALTWAGTSTRTVHSPACAPSFVTTECCHSWPQLHSPLTESPECRLPLR
jgi:hypothetical protein